MWHSGWNDLLEIGAVYAHLIWPIPVLPKVFYVAKDVPATILADEVPEVRPKAHVRDLL